MSCWYQRERNLDWKDHKQYLLKNNSEMKGLPKFYTRNYESFQNSNKRRQYFPIHQKHYNWESLAMKHLQNRNLQQIKDFLQYFIIMYIKQY